MVGSRTAATARSAASGSYIASARRSPAPQRRVLGLCLKDRPSPSSRKSGQAKKYPDLLSAFRLRTCKFVSQKPKWHGSECSPRKPSERVTNPDWTCDTLDQFKVEECPYCRTNSRGGVSSAFSTSSATARKRQRGVRRGCFSILHANRPQSHSANLIPVTRCGRRCCTGNFSLGSG